MALYWLRQDLWLGSGSWKDTGREMKKQLAGTKEELAWIAVIVICTIVFVIEFIGRLIEWGQW